jgi:glutaredoxin
MSSHHHPSIEIFSTPTCPDCQALKAWLEREGVSFVERDLRDPAVAEDAKRRTGVRVAPITIVGGEVFFGPFLQQKPRITAVLGLAEPA